VVGTAKRPCTGNQEGRKKKAGGGRRAGRFHEELVPKFGGRMT